MSKKPIRRSPELITLSREHHYSLLFAWKVAQGLKNNISTERMIRYVQYFWEHHLRQHFKQEQVVLFQKAKGDPLVLKAMAEQKRIIHQLQEILNEKDASKQRDALEGLAKEITTLVRIEERDLFPALEQLLSEQALDTIASELAEMQPDPLQDDYEDEFWETDK